MTNEAAARVDLFDLSHRELTELIARGAPIYLPVNPVEYHGPHLSLRNDHLVGMGLAADLHAGLAKNGSEALPFLVASSLEGGVDPCPGPGSRAVPFLTLRRLVMDACSSLADLGAKRVVLITFHGAPLHAHALDAGVRLLTSRGVRAIQPHNLLMRLLMSVDGSAFPDAFAHVEDPAERAEMMRDMPLDFHAGFGETSLSLHYAPQSVGAFHATLPPCPPIRPDVALLAASRAVAALGQADLATELKFAAFGRGWGNLRPFPGYTGRPHRATAGAGKILARRIVDDYVTATRAVFAGAEGPRPIMPWLPALSGGGAMTASHLRLEDVARFTNHAPA